MNVGAFRWGCYMGYELKRIDIALGCSTDISCIISEIVDPRTSQERIASFVSNENEHVRCYVSNYCKSPDILLKLSSDKLDAVRMHVALCKYITKEITTKLSKDKSVLVRLNIVYNSNTSTDLLKYMIKNDVNEFVRLEAARVLNSCLE